MPHRFVLDPDHPVERVDKVLARLLPSATRSSIQRWITAGNVWIDGATCRPRDLVRPGTVVEVEPLPPPPSAVTPDASVEFGVLFEDEHLIVVDKPAGLVVHPGKGHREGTLVAGLLARPGFERAPFDPLDPEGRLRPGIVHRLDKETSGVLVAAKSDRAREGLKAQLKVHAVDRMYVAITLGVPTSGTIDTLHARHRSSRFRYTSYTEQGRRAVTHASVDEVLAGRRAALVSCRLETGRTHQIRVHLAERANTPILADKLYGRVPDEPTVRAIAEALGRQALHAGLLGFVHPIHGEPMRFSSPLPEDMQGALERLRQMS